jgi:glycosyltransferase involved in cell wall biosynthesis
LVDKKCRNFGCHLKLHPGIIYSHPSSKICWQPLLTEPWSESQYLFAQRSSKYAQPFLQFELSQGRLDWSYPIDFCGGTYRLKDIRIILQQLIEPIAVYCHDDQVIDVKDLLVYGDDINIHIRDKKIVNPNFLEFEMNKIFWQTEYFLSYKTSICPSYYCCCVVTINRVQSLYDVPIFHCNYDINDLNTLLITNELQNDEKCFDFQVYLNHSYCLSAHLGMVTLSSSSCISYTTVQNRPYVSVVIPVYNGEKYLKSCFDSLLFSKQNCLFEIIVVDDGSTDESLTIIESYQKKIKYFHRQLRLQPTLENDDIDISLKFYHRQITDIHIIKSKRVGIAEALDMGVDMAACEFIARIDCDDICYDHRFQRQADFLRLNERINVVGGQALLFHCGDEMVNSSLTVAHGVATHPILTSYITLWRCPLLHPTIMFRKSIVQEVGGYSNISKWSHLDRLSADIPLNVMEQAEDYFLWIRILTRFFNRLNFTARALHFLDHYPLTSC